MEFPARPLSAAIALALVTTPALSEERILVQSTTSTKNSGFYDYIQPLISKDTGVTLSIVAVGTGQAIKNARKCDGDVLLVHAKPAEEKFVASGYGVKRTNLMYNDFVIVGPQSDPARIAGDKSAADALTKIAASGSLFASRGDDSGTNKKENALWKSAGVNPKPHSGNWYRATGSGMGATLNAAIGMNAYTLTDRATWIKFKNKADFKILVEGDKILFNQYGIILVNAAKCPSVKTALGQKVINWFLSKTGQQAINAYKVDGKQLFFANAPQ
ncbi:MAG: substrate-binding domain-containing protein [Hyphomicrobiaceae bacterium]